MTPENVKNLMFALNEHVQKYEQAFGEIKRKTPKAPGNNGNDIPNPFHA